MIFSSGISNFYIGILVSNPAFYSVPVHKLLVMSLCTFGIYDMYWAYRNWRGIAAHSRPEIKPIWRGILMPIFAYFLFKEIWVSARAVRVAGKFMPGWWACAYIVCLFMSGAPWPWQFLTYMMGVLLIWPNYLASKINTASSVMSDKQGFSLWDIAGIFAGLSINALAYMLPSYAS